MADQNISKAATEIANGDGCPALDKYLIGRVEGKDEWRNLLKSVVEANAAQRLKDPSIPELEVVTKPDSIFGERIGVSRKDLEEAGAPNRLVDRIWGLGNSIEISRAYDCSNLEEKYRHGNLPHIKDK